MASASMSCSTSSRPPESKPECVSRFRDADAPCLPARRHTGRPSVCPRRTRLGAVDDLVQAVALALVRLVEGDILGAEQVRLLQRGCEGVTGRRREPSRAQADGGGAHHGASERRESQPRLREWLPDRPRVRCCPPARRALLLGPPRREPPRSGGRRATPASGTACSPSRSVALQAANAGAHANGPDKTRQWRNATTRDGGGGGACSLDIPHAARKSSCGSYDGSSSRSAASRFRVVIRAGGTSSCLPASHAQPGQPSAPRALLRSLPPAALSARAGSSAADPQEQGDPQRVGRSHDLRLRFCATRWHQRRAHSPVHRPPQGPARRGRPGLASGACWAPTHGPGSTCTHVVCPTGKRGRAGLPRCSRSGVAAQGGRPHGVLLQPREAGQHAQGA